MISFRAENKGLFTQRCAGNTGERERPDDKAGYWAHCFIIYSIEQSAYKSILVVMSKAGVSLLFIHSGV